MKQEQINKVIGILKMADEFTPEHMAKLICQIFQPEISSFDAVSPYRIYGKAMTETKSTTGGLLTEEEQISLQQVDIPKGDVMLEHYHYIQRLLKAQQAKTRKEHQAEKQEFVMNIESHSKMSRFDSTAVGGQDNWYRWLDEDWWQSLKAKFMEK